MGSYVNGTGGLAEMAEVISSATDTSQPVAEQQEREPYPWELDHIRDAGPISSITPDASAPMPPPTLWLDGKNGERVPLGINGSLITLMAAPGKGKTAIAEAVACSIGYALDRDTFDKNRTLGFYSEYKTAVYVDTEMEPEDMPARWGRMLNYRLPNSEHQKRITVYSHKEQSRKMRELTGLEQLAKYLEAGQVIARGEGGALLILDRPSDFLPSDNDEEAVRGMWHMLADWAAANRSCVLAIQHQKRNSEEGNGWLYTVGQYKAAASLCVEVVNGTRRIKATKVRRGDMANVDTPYTFDTTVNLFVLADPATLPKPADAKLIAQVDQLRAKFQAVPFTVKQAETLLNCSNNTARTTLQNATDAGLIVLSDAGAGAKSTKLYQVVEHAPTYDDEPPF